MPFVLDSSASLARIAPDEMLPQGIAAALEKQPAIAPAHWPFETLNGLEIMRRRGRLDDHTVTDAVALLLALRVEIEPSDLSRNADAVLPLAREYGLTVYDAAYLELAQRRRLPLATLDKALRGAAGKARVKLI